VAIIDSMVYELREGALSSPVAKYLFLFNFSCSILASIYLIMEVV